MSNYKNFVLDYPNRCNDVLSKFHSIAKGVDREVTLLLCVASTGLVTPYERLKSKEGRFHPSCDSKKFAKQKTWLDGLMGRSFLGSPLHNSKEADSWKFKKLHPPLGEPEGWDLKRHNPLEKNCRVKFVLDIVRNALAHGSVFNNDKGEIKRLVFISYVNQREPEKGFNCLSVHPDEFKTLLECWFTGLLSA